MTRHAALIMPAYRPGETLPRIVAEVRALDSSGIIDSVIVIDDGSGPLYQPVFAALRELPGVEIVVSPRNEGKGAALKRGFATVLQRVPGLAGVVTADVDGQHAPKDVLAVARALLDGDRPVLGVRRFDDQVPFRNRFGNTMTRRVLRWRTGVSVTDTQTGLRGWPMRSVPGLLRMPGNRYEWELAALLSAIHAPLTEVPISTIYGAQGSHFRPLRDSALVWRALLRQPFRPATRSSGR